MDFRPLDPADRSVLQRILSPLRLPANRLMRWAWNLSSPSRSTWFDSRRWRAVWNVNRWFTATPRVRPELEIMRFGPRVCMELDLSRLTDVLAYCYGPGEIEVAYACRTLCPRDGVVADIGGNIGTTTLAFAAHVVDGQVHTFEPSKDMQACLRRNIELSRAGNVTVHGFGLSDEESRGHLQVAIDGNPGSAFVSDDTAGQEIEIRRLDDVLAPEQRLDFVKIDVEGFELRALKGGEQVLRAQRPSILFEVNESALQRAGTSGREVCEYLVGLGYAMHYLERGRLRDYDIATMTERKLHNVIAIMPK